MNRHLYLISGMGSDERVFRNLRFPENYTLHFIPWLEPYPEEPLGEYARRMAVGIPEGDDDITLLGVSMGGMVCLEIARIRAVRKIIMISSLKHTRERPVYFNLIRNTRLLSLFVLPDALLFGFPRRLVVPFFLKAESPEEKKLLLEYARKKDYKYTRWAIRTLINWKNEELPSPVVHIHGAKDLTLPIHTVNADYVIPDGGHFMVYNRSGEINAILHKELA